MSKLTKESRDALPADDFAVPGKRVLPIHDAKHVRFAWEEVGNTKDLTDAERKEARHRIIERAKTHGIDTADWEKGRLNARASLNVVYAMSLDIDTDDGHPNKMPFKGVLTRIDEPSDSPPEGSGGKRIIISTEAATKGLKTLLGMAVDYVPKMDGHNPQAKIGLITSATIEHATRAIEIEGYIYAADFPEVAAEIKANKDKLGFSYEAVKLFVADPDANPVTVTECTFTGAAILLKDKAAYRTTSISASAEKGYKMDDETKKVIDGLTKGFTDLQASLATSIASIAASVAKGPEKVQANAHTIAMVEPHAKACEACADGMMAAGIGGHPQHGHAIVLRKMAGSMRAAAAMGQVPHIFRDHDFMHASAETDPGKAGEAMTKLIADALKPITDKVEAFGTQITDLKAAAVKTATAPERKTLPSQITQLLAKAGVEPDKATGKVEIGKVDEMLKTAGIVEPSARLTMKASMRQHGLID